VRALRCALTTYNGDMKVSRRKLLLAAAATASAQASAQAPPTPTSQSGDADVEAARLRQRIGAQVIARVPLPMPTEPAFQFKA
jgi:hypothetical protein